MPKSVTACYIFTESPGPTLTAYSWHSRGSFAPMARPIAASHLDYAMYYLARILLKLDLKSPG